MICTYVEKLNDNLANFLFYKSVSTLGACYTGKKLTERYFNQSEILSRTFYLRVLFFAVDLIKTAVVTVFTPSRAVKRRLWQSIVDPISLICLCISIAIIRSLRNRIKKKKIKNKPVIFKCKLFAMLKSINTLIHVGSS